MEKMSRKKALQMVATVAFIGIILTFSIIFVTTALFSEKTISNTNFDGSESQKGVFSAFDNACLHNKKFYSIINRYEYQLFNHIPESDVVSGKNGFLFNADTNEYGYDYLDDYSGEITLTLDQLDRFYRYIEMRSRAYENFGCEYMLAVIPNAQSIYGEYMPAYLGNISQNTILSQIGAYLELQKFDKFIDLRACMTEGKDRGQLYNNTENSINALGAYVAYSGILEHLEAVYGKDISILGGDHFDLQTRVTDGKLLAKKTGLSSLIKNKTTYIADENIHIYSLVELFGDLETTYVKYESIGDASSVTVMIECGQEWDKVQLMPYFSSTFSRVSYRVAHTYNKVAVENSVPQVVIQVIREDELSSILDADVISSYEAGLEPGQHPYKTKEATELAYSKVGAGKYCISGRAEGGAEITIFGDVVETVVLSELDGRFFGIVEVNDQTLDSQICVSVKSSGKTVSDVSYLMIEPDDSMVSKRPVFIGSNGMLYKDDYNVTPIPSDAVVEEFENAVSAYFSNISQKNTSVGAKMIFALIPEKISVYKDGLSDVLYEDYSELMAKRILLRRTFESCGVAFLDGAETLKKNMSGTKLYYQTFDELTDVGGFYIYRDIILRVSRNYLSVTPNTLESYKLLRQRMGTGHLALSLGYKTLSVNEIAYRIIVEKQYKTVYNDDSGDATKGFVTYMENQNLPSAVIMRSEGSDKIIEMMAEHFSEMHVLPVGTTEIPTDILANGVDYVIVLASELDIEIG